MENQSIPREPHDELTLTFREPALSAIRLMMHELNDVVTEKEVLLKCLGIVLQARGLEIILSEPGNRRQLVMSQETLWRTR